MIFILSIWLSVLKHIKENDQKLGCKILVYYIVIYCFCIVLFTNLGLHTEVWIRFCE